MVGSSKTAENSTGPSHVLFAVSPNANTNSNTNSNTRTPTTATAAASIHISSHDKFKKRLLCDPRLDKDYVSKRQRAHEEFSGWTTTTTTTTTTPWEGVSGFEQELVKCCQDLPDDYYESDEEDNNNNNNNNNNNDVVDDGIITDDKNAMMIMMLPSIGGVLAVEKEARFAALISRCHTMASKCLAMAILERTLEAYLEETAREQQQQHDETTTTTTNDTTPDNVAAAASEYKSNRRFRLFFAAGGLRILNQWLAEASSTNNTKSFDGLSSKQQQKASTTTTKTTMTTTMMTTTRPIALSILLFLQHIPFDKKTVTNSKINKQVQKLGKKIASIQEAHQNQLAPMEEQEEEDLNLWTIQNNNNNNKKESLVQILAAIDAVKASWREKAKEKKLQNAISLSADPFGRLQSKIRERFKVWNDFEARNEKPDWYRSPYTKQKNSTEAERILQTKIKQMQSRSQKSLQQLRAKLRKQQQQQQQLHSSVNNHNKTVKWKDASSNREEKLLEDVIVFEKDLPPCSVGTDLSA